MGRAEGTGPEALVAPTRPLAPLPRRGCHATPAILHACLGSRLAGRCRRGSWNWSQEPHGGLPPARVRRASPTRGTESLACAPGRSMGADHDPDARVLRAERLPGPLILSPLTGHAPCLARLPCACGGVSAPCACPRGLRLVTRREDIRSLDAVQFDVGKTVALAMVLSLVGVAGYFALGAFVASTAGQPK